MVRYLGEHDRYLSFLVQGREEKENTRYQVGERPRETDTIQNKACIEPEKMDGEVIDQIEDTVEVKAEDHRARGSGQRHD